MNLWAITGVLTNSEEVLENTPQVTPQVTPHVPPQVRELLLVMKGEAGRDELLSALGLSDRKSFRERFLKPALRAGLIEMTIPDKPSSPLQKYRITQAGRLVK